MQKATAQKKYHKLRVGHMLDMAESQSELVAYIAIHHLDRFWYPLYTDVFSNWLLPTMLSNRIMPLKPAAMESWPPEAKII